MGHGWAKLSRGPEHFEELLVQIGAPCPYFTSWASPLVEIFGGLAIFVGAFDRLSPPMLGRFDGGVVCFRVHLE